MAEGQNERPPLCLRPISEGSAITYKRRLQRARGCPKERGPLSHYLATFKELFKRAPGLSPQSPKAEMASNHKLSSAIRNHLLNGLFAIFGNQSLLKAVKTFRHKTVRISDSI